jgi:hypothetical protein
VQVNEEVGLGGMGQRAVRYLLCYGRVAGHGRGGVSEPTTRRSGQAELTGELETAWLKSADTGAGRLADQQRCVAGQPAQCPFIHRLRRAARSAHCLAAVAGNSVSRRVGLSERAACVTAPANPDRC